MNTIELLRRAAACCAGVAAAATAFGDDVPCRTGAIFGEARRVYGSHNKVMSVCVEGSFLYAGEGSEICVYDISDPLKPKRLGQTSGAGGSRQIAAKNGMLFISRCAIIHDERARICLLDAPCRTKMASFPLRSSRRWD